MTLGYVIIGAIITILFVSPIIEMVEASSSKEDKSEFAKFITDRNVVIIPDFSDICNTVY
jgi:hypothetical protein